jgi:hypothetical protein
MPSNWRRAVRRPILERAQALSFTGLIIGTVAPDFLPCCDDGVISVTARRSNADHLLGGAAQRTKASKRLKSGMRRADRCSN